MNLGGPVALEAVTPSEDHLAEFVPNLRGAAKATASGAAGVKSYGASPNRTLTDDIACDGCDAEHDADDPEVQDVAEVETHTTCCHNCQEQGEEVEVELLPVDGVFKGVCACGCEATFECPPDVEQFGELAEEDRNEWVEKAKAENPDKKMSDQEWWGRGRTLYIKSLYETAGGEW
jgi:hypothetical protein